MGDRNLPHIGASTDEQEVNASLDQVIPSQVFTRHVDETVFHKVEKLLDRHPDRALRAWDKSSRLYVILRLLGINHDSQAFEKLRREDVRDFWLPLSTNILKPLLSSTDLPLRDFENTQHHVLSTAECLDRDLSSTDVFEHQHIRDGRQYFEDLDTLGKGATAEVLKVRHRPTGKCFACKRIYRAGTKKGGACTTKTEKARLRVFQQEVQILQRITHHHLVIFVASFTDLETFSLILNPVAEDVLKFVLERQSRENPLDKEAIQMLRRTFLCLATAISYLHEHKVRHKDIKPGNILLSEGSVRLCDFGISRSWSNEEKDTTEGQVFDFTPRYCALEVSEFTPRNTASDIWSLGCVFLEIVTVIKGFVLDEMNAFLREHSDGASDRQGLCYAHDAILAWMVKIRHGDSADDLPLDWITPMIRSEPSERVKAKNVREMIMQQASKIPQPNLYLSRCCTRSDSMSPLEILETPSVAKPVLSQTPAEPRIVSSVENHTRPEDQSGSASRQSLAPPRPSEVSDNLPGSATPSTEESPSSFSRRSQESFASSQNHPVASNPGGNPQNSVAERSFEPPSIGFEPKCLCSRNTSERHIFEAVCESIDLEPLELSAETFSKCELSRSQVHLYESPCGDSNAAAPPIPSLWRVTRRLVVSYLSGSPALRHCTSFWLPLADLHFAINNTKVTLYFSDCNQIHARPSGSWGFYYDWVYDGLKTNNTIQLQFASSHEAHKFVDAVRLPYEDGVTVRRSRHIGPFQARQQQQEAHVFDIGRRGIRNYRAITLTTSVNGTNHSKLFIQWPEVDIHIRLPRDRRTHLVRTPKYTMTLDIHNVSTPTYHSDVRGEPAKNYDKIGRFKKALQLKSTLSVAFSLGDKHTLPNPPAEIVNVLSALTGWRLLYFGCVQTFKSRNKLWMSKKHGRADLMLWEKAAEPHTVSHTIESRITLRQHDVTDSTWTSGKITNTTNTTLSSSADASVTIASKCRGLLLDISSMTAIMSERSEAGNTSTNSLLPNDVDHEDLDEDQSKLILSFEDASSRKQFLKVMEHLKTKGPSDESL